MDVITDLCDAIDAGDDACLTILSDALEESGDSRAGGLRQAVGHRPYRVDFINGSTGWGWSMEAVLHRGMPKAKAARIVAWRNDGEPYHPSRSAAYLFFAAALLDPTD